MFQNEFLISINILHPNISFVFIVKPIFGVIAHPAYTVVYSQQTNPETCHHPEQIFKFKNLPFEHNLVSFQISPWTLCLYHFFDFIKMSLHSLGFAYCLNTPLSVFDFFLIQLGQCGLSLQIPLTTPSSTWPFVFPEHLTGASLMVPSKCWPTPTNWSWRMFMEGLYTTLLVVVRKLVRSNSCSLTPNSVLLTFSKVARKHLSSFFHFCLHLWCQSS